MNGRRIILTMAAALALVAGGTAAGAAIASGPVDSSGVVHGCYATNAIKGSHFFVLQDAGTVVPKGHDGDHVEPAGSPRPTGVSRTTGCSRIARACGNIWLEWSSTVHYKFGER